MARGRDRWSGGAADGGGGLAEREPDSAVSGAGAGGDSAAPGSGGAGGEPDDDVPLPRGLLLAIEVYQNGGEADLDEDGQVDLEVDLEDTRHVARVLEGGEVLLTVTRLSDGTTTKLGDLDRDGELDYREDEVESAQGFRRSTERDVDFDGVSDERESFEIDLASGETHLRREVFDGEAWQVASEETDVSGLVGAGVNEGCTDYVPTDLKSNREVNVFGHVRIVQCAADSAGNCIPASRQGNRRGGCSAAQAKQIKQALAKLFQVGLSELGSLSENAIRESSVAKCLEKRRPGLLDGLINNVARGGAGLGDESGSSGIFSGTRFSCGISCEPGSRVSLGNTSRLVASA